MPNVLLLGDSISLGYRNFVRDNLRGVMNVYYPPENGRFAAYTFRALYEWSRDLKWSADMDFVYWNNGLWDVARIFGDEPQTPLQDYAVMIQRVFNRLHYLFPKARIIFATTTPVVQELFDKKIFYRRNEDIRLYNETAARIVLQNGGMIHDLYNAGYRKEFYQDSTHFKPQISQLIAKEIADLLKNLSSPKN